MTEHAANGIYDGAAITLWERGSSAAVIWKSGAKHRGMQIRCLFWNENFSMVCPSLQGDMLIDFASLEKMATLALLKSASRMAT